MVPYCAEVHCCARAATETATESTRERPSVNLLKRIDCDTEIPLQRFQKHGGSLSPRGNLERWNTVAYLLLFTHPPHKRRSHSHPGETKGPLGQRILLNSIEFLDTG